MKKTLAVFLLLFIFLISGCTRKSEQQTDNYLSVLVFITGVIAGSPTYELMAEGALEFANNNPDVTVKIYEAGMNQAEWEQQMKEMISTGEYDIVLGSNPSLPEICENAARMFPNQKFIITDAEYEGNPQIKTYLYNQYEQSFFLGYLAGLITTSTMPYAESRKRIGFIAAQEYPLLTEQMVPGFIEGAQLVDPAIELDFRVIGSWADANKAAELASAMMGSGVDVFTAIAGGAAQGMIKTAVERGAYIVWYNTDAYDLAPGVIVGCGLLEQKKLIIEILNDVLENKIQYGTAETLGVKEGYIKFSFDNPSYQGLPVSIREKFEMFFENLIHGELGIGTGD